MGTRLLYTSVNSLAVISPHVGPIQVLLERISFADAVRWLAVAVSGEVPLNSGSTPTGRGGWSRGW